MVVNLVQNLLFRTKIIVALLTRSNIVIPITEQVLRCSVQLRPTGFPIFLLELPRAKKAITEYPFWILPKKGSVSDLTGLSVLFDKRGEDILISEDMVLNAATNDRAGDRIMALLLSKSKPKISPVPDSVVPCSRPWRIRHVESRCYHFS